MREGLFDAKLPEVGENEVPLGPLAIFPVPFLLRTPGILSHILTHGIPMASDYHF